MAVIHGAIGAFTLLIFLSAYKKSLHPLRMWDFFCTFAPVLLY